MGAALAAALVAWLGSLLAGSVAVTLAAAVSVAVAGGVTIESDAAPVVLICTLVVAAPDCVGSSVGETVAERASLVESADPPVLTAAAVFVSAVLKASEVLLGSVLTTVELPAVKSMPRSRLISLGK